MKNRNMWTIAIGVVIAVAGFLAYRQIADKKAAADTPAVETATVQRGDLSITVEAAGSLTPPTEFTLTFPTAGNIYEIPVVEGQIVKQDDVLARLEASLQAEADFQALFSKAGIAQAELALINAQVGLNNAVDDLANLIGLDAWWWEKQLEQAEDRLSALEQDLNATPEQTSAAKREVEVARGWRDYYREVNIEKLEKEYKVFKTIRMKGHTRHIYLYSVYYKVDTELILAYANLESAKVALQDARAALEIVRAGPAALTAPIAAPGPQMARLERARLNLENTRLLAPADGVATEVNFQSGGYVTSGAPVVVVSDLSVLEAVVNLDETDIHRIQVGMPVVAFADAFPGQRLTGQVTEIAFSADIKSGVVLYPVTVRLDPSDLPLRSGMTVNVTFPIERRSDALLVPFRAVETEGGQAYVTRVTASGSERVAVTLGLITDTQVEILSGLEEGDVVTVNADPVFGEGQ